MSNTFSSALVLLAAFAAAAMGGEDVPATRTSVQAADAVQEAASAGDDARLDELAESAAPDPWLVASELCSRGGHDVALSFARAGERVDTEMLPEYIESRRGAAAETDAREALRRAHEKLRGEDLAAVAEVLDELGDLDDPVLALTARHYRGLALQVPGKYRESFTLLGECAEAALELGWLSRASRCFGDQGVSAYRASDARGAHAAWQRRLELAEKRGDPSAKASASGNLALLFQALGDFRRALDMQIRVVEMVKELDDPRRLADALNNVGTTYYRLSDYENARDYIARALQSYEELGHEDGCASALGNLGAIELRLGDLVSALERMQRALAMERKRGDELAAARSLGNIAIVQMTLGRLATARELYQEALEEKTRLGDRFGAANTMGNLAELFRREGRMAGAMRWVVRARDEFTELGNRDGVARMFQLEGTLATNFRDWDRAETAYQQALDIYGETGNRIAAALVLHSLAGVHIGRDDLAEAISFAERALAEMKAIGDPLGQAQAMAKLGEIRAKAGDLQNAEKTLRDAIREIESIAGKSATLDWRNLLGQVLNGAGEHDAARELFRSCLEDARELGLLAEEVAALRELALTETVSGDPSKGIAFAREAIERMGGLVGGLSDEEGATARGAWLRVFDTGLSAATRVGDAAAATYFVESARAGTLLESLQTRDALTDVALPPELVEADVAARAAETAAAQAHRRAVDSRKLRAIRDASKALEEARRRRIDVAARIQREAKAAASVIYPTAAELPEIQRWLQPDEALVLYAVSELDAAAVVVTQDSARAIVIGTSEEVDAACAALDAGTPGSATDDAVAALVERVVTPLALDSKKVKRVLVSPDAALSYVPFALLMPDQEVVYVPSGTTYGALLESGAATGKKTLALGDPEYDAVAQADGAARLRGGAKLVPLPATRIEAKAIGDVVLLGADATESNLGAALAKEQQWASVHLACHGLVDSARPMLSSLAITPSEEDDGFLSVLDVFRMSIPADLAVLSACETARGRVAQGEGIVGLTRAFMFAGVPRVVVSLWKVDDEATRALMEHFYASRAKGHPTATALREAQRFVRSQKKWEHPAYWAAWQLWGRGD